LMDLHLSWTLTPEAFALLASSPRLGNLTVLNLTGLGLDNMSAHLLANAPHLRRLTVLDLSHNLIHPSGAQALLTSPNLPRLRRLYLMGDQQEAFIEIRRHFGDRLQYTPFEYQTGGEEELE